jgi:porin
MTARRGAVRRVIVRGARWLLLGVVAGLGIPGAAAAQPVQIPETFAGDLWTRPRLTGDWFGLRDEMGKKGLTLDLDMLNILQGNGTGGRRTEVDYDGLVNYELNLDTGKLGLWPGGFLRIKAFSTFGDTVNNAAGGTIPANFVGLLPQPDNSTTSALVNLTFMQFFTKWFGVYAGKAYTLGGDDNAFAHNFNTQFLNTALNFNTTLGFAPFSAYGGGLVFIPWEGATITASLIDPSGTPTNNDISEAFRDGFAVGAEGRVTIKPFGLVGHQDVGFFWSDKTRTSLQQDPSNIARGLLGDRFTRLQDPGPVLRRILERFFPELLVPVQALNQKSSTWSIYYNFDQYLWSPAGAPDRGVGLFFRFGASDGNPNPIKYAYNVGFSINGLVPGRPKDNIGLGWARTQYSGDFVPFLREKLDLGLTVEDAVELYYNAVVTPWLNLNVNVEVVQSALKKTLNSSGQLVNMDTAVVGGLRAYIRF